MRRRELLVPVAAISLLVGDVARAATPVEQRRALEQSTRLDLSSEWAGYERRNAGRSFRQYVEGRWRIRRDIGRGMAMTAASLAVIGTFILFFGLCQEREDGRPLILAGASSLGVAGGLAVAGGALWGAYYRRLERLDDYELTLGKVRLQSAGPLMLPQGGGLAVRLAF